MSARVKDLLRWIDETAPFRFAAPWDNCGLQAGDPEDTVERVLVALDPSSESMDEARDLGCRCLVTHHPLLFKPVSSVRTDRFPESLVFRAVREGLNVISAHTNLDVALGGTNHRWARDLGLEPVEPIEDEARFRNEERYSGMGLAGLLPEAIPFDRFLDRVRAIARGAAVRTAGPTDGRVRFVAVCTGSGGSLIERVLALGADAYISGDIKYHEAQRAVEAGLAVLDVGHFASERIVLEDLAEELRTKSAREGASLDVRVSGREKDPFVTTLGS